MFVKTINLFNPTVLFCDDFLEEEKCDAIVEKAKEQKILQPSQVVDNSDPKNSVESRFRTSEHGSLAWTDCPEAWEFAQRVSYFLSLRIEQAEPLQVVRYDLGQQYEPHLDAFDPNSADHKEYRIGNSGNRVATALLYLTTPIEGGGTVFPELIDRSNNSEKRIDAKKGRCVFFTNTYMGLQDPHPHARHGGEPIVKGEKWACNLWFRSNIYQPSYQKTEKDSQKG